MLREYDSAGGWGGSVGGHEQAITKGANRESQLMG